MAVVYRHTHDDGTIFYIGIGKKLKRAYTKDRRSPIWKYAVNKYGLNNMAEKHSEKEYWLI